MLQHTPFSLALAVLFVAVTLLTLILFIRLLRKSALVPDRRTTMFIVIGLLVWIDIQAILSWRDVYSTNLDLVPPRLMVFGVLPALVAIIALFVLRSGRNWLDTLSIEHLTLIHIVRIPVELGLYWLAHEKAIPEVMTFEGRNFDILAGLTAPIVAVWGIRRGNMGSNSLLIWNILCLGLLFNIVITAVLAAPLPFQQIAFDTPNRAVLYFPVSWLPTFIVPVVLFAHLATIRQLLGIPQKLS